MRSLRLKYAQYRLINSILFYINYDAVLLRCLEHEDAEKVLREIHDGLPGGNFAGDTTSHKILRVSYYWPNLFRDTHTYAINYKSCQMSAGREKRAFVPLQSVTISRPFEKWGLDVIGDITLSSSKQHKYILIAIDYFTIWTEAISMTHMNERL
jgi:hypothetical protein